MSTARIAVPRYRRGAGPTLLAHGFRPFFLAAAVWAALAVPAWLAVLFGALELPTGFDLLAWHVHEMLYGYAVAAVVGFLLTAIPNWTGRMPLQGLPLLALALLWLAGRVAVATSAWTGAGVAAAVDLGFLVAVLAVVVREIVTGRNWRNLPVVGALTLLLAGNATMQAGVAGLIDDDGLGWRIALATLATLISLIGGRIVPSFTRNWLARRAPGGLPAAFGAVDKVALVLTGAGMALWVLQPDGRLAGLVLLFAGATQAVRLARWQGHRTLAEPLLAVLHLGYAWVPASLALLGAAALDAVPQSLALHALTAGAIGTMTLAVMTRATLGHTGRALIADRPTVAIFAAVTLAALTRLAAVLLPDQATVLWTLSAAAWVAAFGGFAVVYGRYLVRPNT